VITGWIDFVNGLMAFSFLAFFSVDFAVGSPVVERQGYFRTELLGGNLFCFAHDSEDVAAHDLVDLHGRVAPVEQFLGD